MTHQASQIWGCLFLHLLTLVPVFLGDPTDSPSPMDSPTQSSQAPGPALCPSVLSPLDGSFHVAEGTGRSVGSLVLFRCQQGFQLIGSGKVRCLLREETPQWSEPQPQCEAIPQDYHRGFRLAVIVSLVSCLIILTMCVFFMLCCVKQAQLRLQEEEEETESRVCRQRDEAPDFPGADEGERGSSSPERPLQGLLSSACLRGGARFENREYLGCHKNLHQLIAEDSWSQWKKQDLSIGGHVTRGCPTLT
ncbi:uncharacterized protein LOC108704362 [Xenopus laevis]|uniref:Uncharacterized protein LOC108704362 n=1 Tax=Xenopus laevis TaxID=8355 RepID=A0A8J1MJZ8_XENLA|nr:uncharacterized protein LOC108704362 [Xenopus laevis]